jgi:hypothetical protein
VAGMVAPRFEKAADNMDAQFDVVEQRLLLMREPFLKQTTKVDLYWEGITPSEIVVTFDVPNVATVVGPPKEMPGRLTYELLGLNSGHTTLIARRSGPASAYSPQAALKVQVSGADYKQFDARWGNKAYGKGADGIAYGTLTASGCGPSSLAIVMDYLIRLRSWERGQCGDGMEVERAVDYAVANGARVPNGGTRIQTLFGRLHKLGPGFSGVALKEISEVVAELRRGTPLVLVCHGVTVYRYGKGGKKSSIRMMGTLSRWWG